MTHSGYVPVDGFDMYYEIHGEGRPLVLLHGAFQTIDLMGPIVPALAASRQVIAVESQGQGRSGGADQPLSYPGMADHTHALLRHLEIETADLFGYSMGGAIAQQVAIRHPDAVRRLVIASAAFSSAGAHSVVLEMMPTLTADVFAGSPIEEAYQRLAPDPDAFPALVEGIKALDTAEWSWEEDVKRITAPTLLVVGDSDGTRLEHVVEWFNLLGGGVMGDLGGLPKSQLAVLPGTTHYVPPGSGLLDRSDWLVPMIDRFLDADA